MSGEIVLIGARWHSVKWWACNGREDLTQRAVLSVNSLRSAGFLARIGERTNEAFAEFERAHPEHGPHTYTTLLRVEVYGTDDIFEKARTHLHGFWAAINSKGMTSDYREGYSNGIAVLREVGTKKPAQLPLNKPKRLKA